MFNKQPDKFIIAMTIFWVVVLREIIYGYGTLQKHTRS
jgi:hypothetical protein